MGGGKGEKRLTISRTRFLTEGEQESCGISTSLAHNPGIPDHGTKSKLSPGEREAIVRLRNKTLKQ